MTMRGCTNIPLGQGQGQVVPIQVFECHTPLLALDEVATFVDHHQEYCTLTNVHSGRVHPGDNKRSTDAHHPFYICHKTLLSVCQSSGWTWMRNVGECVQI